MDDRILQPAFAVYNSPGVYALLLGSGTSRSAEIMTGGEILDDLIQQIAAAKNATIETTSVEWYLQHFNQTPGYDVLLHQLGKTQLDRRALLEKNFVPDETDLEEGRKQPTKAHDAIAWLVQQGYIRVIITTNFDRLMEMALERIGITPNVISSNEDALTHLEPRHAPITILKIHGDYLSANLRNTPEELSDYSNEPRLFKWLKDTVSEYGLIIAGWSGITDKGLVELLETHKARHGSFWISFEEPNENATRIIQARSASLIKNLGADDFFGELREMVEALRSRANQNPLTVDVAVARVKKMIPRSELQIDLEDFLRETHEKAYQSFISPEFDEKVLDKLKVGRYDTDEKFLVYMETYLSRSEVSLHTYITLSLYGDEQHKNLVTEAINRWLRPGNTRGFRWESFLAAWMLIYASGIGAIFKQRWSYLYEILANSEVKRPAYSTELDSYGNLQRVVSSIPAIILIINESFDQYHRLDHGGKTWGEAFKQPLRMLFKNIIRSDEDFNYFYHLFEILLLVSQEYQNRLFDSSSIHFRVESIEVLSRYFKKPDLSSSLRLNKFWNDGLKTGNNWDLLSLFNNDFIFLQELLKKREKSWGLNIE